MWAWQMLEDIEQRDDIHHSELREIVLVGHAPQHAQTLFLAKGRGFLRNLDTSHVEGMARFLQEEAIGAANIKKTPAGTAFLDKIDGIAKFSPQHRLGAAIIRVAVRMPAGEIVAGIIGAGIEIARLCATETALGAL